MSARDRLVADLDGALDDTYQVAGTFEVPDALEAGRRAVRCWTDQLTPGPTIGTLTVGLVLWVLTPATTPAAADTDLDAALVDVLGVLHPLEWVRWTTATRGVLEDRWHGYRFELTAGATITTTEEGIPA